MNTPLMIAQRQLDIAASAASLSDELHNRLTSATSALDQIESILGDLRWFIQSSPKMYTEDPSSVIRNAVKLARHRIQYDTGIELDLPDLSPLSISAGKLSQVIINLIFNASKARRPEQKMVQIKIEATETDGWLKLSVSDDGCGIPSHLQQRVFDPFYTSRFDEGMGLGLAICQSLVSNAGGRIELDSTVGEGTCFSIHLPTELNFKVEATRPALTRIPPKSVLVVDDNEELLDVMNDLLSPNKVTLCSTVDAAKQAMGYEDFDAVICDIMMPHSGALDLLQYLEGTLHPLQNRLIFITGGSVKPAAERYINLKNKPILYKPFTRRDLLDALTSIDSLSHG